MKISDLINILEDVKKFHGDKHIWGIEDLDTVCTREFSMELVQNVTRTDHGWKGGKASETERIVVSCHYEDDGSLEDRSISAEDEDF